MADWQALVKTYRIAKARLELHTAEWPEGEFPPADWQDKLERLAQASSTAMNALLLTPAPSYFALAEKLAIIADEDLADGWHLAREIISLAALDARRLQQDCSWGPK